ncbi:zf-HC2 domain-containing protein [Chloroflexota bacterium]
MRCKEFKWMLALHDSGELSPEENQAVQEHVDICEKCRRERDELSKVPALLQELHTDQWSADVRSQVRERLYASAAEGHASQKRTAKTIGRGPTPRLLRPVLFAAPIVAVIIALLVTQLPGINPQGVISKAYAATAGLQSYRMSGSTISTFNGESSETAFMWEFTEPGNYRGELTTGGETNEFIITGDRQYAQYSDSRESSGTVVIVTDSIFSPIPSREGTLQLLDSLADLEELPDEEINGLGSLHYRGRVDIDRIVDDQIAALDPEWPEYEQMAEAMEMQRSININVELWINKEDYSLLQMNLDAQSPRFVAAAPVFESGSDVMQEAGFISYSTSARYYDFNEAIEVDHPLTESGALEQGWSLTEDSPPSPTVEFSPGGE